MSEPPESQRPRWEWANLGFNTVAKLWFLELYNYLGLIETFQAKEVSLIGGAAVQYQWPEKGKPMWHVRERIFSQEVNKIEYDQKGTLVVEFVVNHVVPEDIPRDFDSITYAYSLTNSRGFVEFRGKDNEVIKRINDRWIAVEGLVRRTSGEYPNIRLTARKEDVGNILVTNTCVVIQGTNEQASVVSGLNSAQTSD
jgi:hypothetical protein